MLVASFFHPLVHFAGTDAGTPVFIVLGIFAPGVGTYGAVRRNTLDRITVAVALITVAIAVGATSTVIVGHDQLNARNRHTDQLKLAVATRTVINAEQSFYRTHGRYTITPALDLPNDRSLRLLVDNGVSATSQTPGAALQQLSMTSKTVVFETAVNSGTLTVTLRDGGVAAAFCRSTDHLWNCSRQGLWTPAQALRVRAGLPAAA